MTQGSLREWVAFAWACGIAIGIVVGGMGCNGSIADKGASNAPAGPSEEDLEELSKEKPRLVPPETIIRTYLQIFGGLSPLEAERALQENGGGTFTRWNDYLDALGLPDHQEDLPRKRQTDQIMLASLERIGIALCSHCISSSKSGAVAW